MLTKIRSRNQQFIGCVSKINVNANNLRWININFQTACDNLQKCADDVNMNKDICLKNFKRDQEIFCDGYGRFSLFNWRKTYCRKIAKNNLIFAYDLEDSIFSRNSLAFNGTLEANSLNFGDEVCLRRS